MNMSLLINLKNEKGFALITVYLTSALILTLSGANYLRVFTQARAVERDIATMSAYYAAEGALQVALEQIWTANAFIGDLSAVNIPDNEIENRIEGLIGNQVDIQTDPLDYTGEADWVIIRTQATIDSNGSGAIDADDRRVKLEGRAFLNSDFSKYMMYTTVSNIGLGANLTLGDYPGGVVPANLFDRMQIYYKNGVNFSGSNINIYGDLHSETQILGNSNSATLRGDVYAKNFQTNPTTGAVTSTGITSGSSLQISDGIGCKSFPCAPAVGAPDDVDRNGDGSITLADAPDIHQLINPKDPNAPQTLPPGAKKTDPLPIIDYSFYQNSERNSIPSFNGTSAQTRFLKLEAVESTPGNKVTKVVEYTNGNFTTPKDPPSEYVLKTNAVVYVNGDVYTKGEVAGRVSVVSSGHMHFAGHVKYAGNQNLSSKNHSAAFLSKEQIRFLPKDLEVSGILYANNKANNSVGMEARYKLNSSTGLAENDGGASKSGGHFRLYGNNITHNGTITTSVYGPDRAFLYDLNLKYYRPQGIPITNPELRMVREIEP
jgi:hypothetical protein